MQKYILHRTKHASMNVNIKNKNNLIYMYSAHFGDF